MPSLDEPLQSSSSSSSGLIFHLTHLLGSPPSDEEQIEFLSKISKFKPVICSIVPPHSDLFKPTSTIVNLPSPLPELYHPQNEELTYTELLEVCDQVTIMITGEETAKIEAFTQSQSKNSAWFTQRSGRITASIMKSVCGTDPGNPL